MQLTRILTLPCTHMHTHTHTHARTHTHTQHTHTHRTPLILCTGSEGLACLTTLIKQLSQSQINTCDNEKMTALHWSAYNNATDSLKALLKAVSNQQCASCIAVRAEWVYEDRTWLLCTRATRQRVVYFNALANVLHSCW